jgi:hypothetical protein
METDHEKYGKSAPTTALAPAGASVAEGRTDSAGQLSSSLPLLGTPVMMSSGRSCRMVTLPSASRLSAEGGGNQAITVLADMSEAFAPVMAAIVTSPRICRTARHAFTRHYRLSRDTRRTDYLSDLWERSRHQTQRRDRFLAVERQKVIFIAVTVDSLHCAGVTPNRWQ